MPNPKIVNRKWNFIAVSFFLTIFMYLYSANIQILSSFHALSRVTTLINICLTLLISYLVTFLNIKRIDIWKENYFLKKESKPSKRPKKIQATKFSNFLNFLFGIWIISLFVIIGFINIVMPPNNYDSMTYHLPRMESWLQNGSLYGFQSQIDRQIWNPQLSELLFLIPRVIFVNDHSLASIQYFCLLFFILISRAWLKSTGAPLLTRNVFTLWLLAWPTVTLEASTTQNDLITAFTCLLTWISLRTTILKHANPLASIFFGMTLAINISSKGTGLLFSACAFFIYFTKVCTEKKLFSQILIVLPIALSINIPLWLQNLSQFGSPLSPKAPPVFDPLVTSFNPTVFVENLVRLISTNLGLPIQSWNLTLEKFTISILNTIGLDANNPDSTWNGGFKIVVYANEDLAASILIVFTLITSVYLLSRKLWWKKLADFAPVDALPIVFTLIAIYVLRNQPWINRLFVPSYLLCTLVLTLNLFHLKKRAKVIASFLAISGMVYSNIFVLHTQNKPLLKNSVFGAPANVMSILELSEYQKLFLNNGQLGSSYLFQTQKIQNDGFKEIYINSGSDSWEYPIWKFSDSGKKGVEIHSYLEYENRKTPSPAVICIDIVCDSNTSKKNYFNVEKIVGTGIETIVPIDKKVKITSRESTIPDLESDIDKVVNGEVRKEMFLASFPFVIGTNVVPKNITGVLIIDGIPSSLLNNGKIIIRLNNRILGEFDTASSSLKHMSFTVSSADYFNSPDLPRLRLTAALNPERTFEFSESLLENRNDLTMEIEIDDLMK